MLLYVRNTIDERAENERSMEYALKARSNAIFDERGDVVRHIFKWILFFYGYFRVLGE